MCSHLPVRLLGEDAVSDALARELFRCGWVSDCVLNWACYLFNNLFNRTIPPNKYRPDVFSRIVRLQYFLFVSLEFFFI